MSKVFIRKSKESKPVVAICYDFDKTLSPDDMQAQGYIQSVGDEVESFWKESNGLAEENEMDQNLAYMFTMIRKAHGKVLFTKKALMDYGAKVQLFPGVETWFKRIRDYGVDKGVIVEHYIISSGLKEMIEGTKVANEFEKIYASSFYYDKDGVAQWPAQVINYTSKTQFLFRIEKGTLEKKLDLLKTACGGNVSDLTVRFLELVFKEGRESSLQFMATAYLTLYRKHKNIIRGKLTTAVPVSQETEAKMKQMVENRTHGNVEFNTEVDPSIIGGFILEYDTYSFDASVRTKLKGVLHQLTV